LAGKFDTRSHRKQWSQRNRNLPCRRLPHSAYQYQGTSTSRYDGIKFCVFRLDWWPGLPDFSWYNIPKRGKYTK
jgi:hypothetical protein